ncbi:flagellar motor switch protein FliG [Pelagibaculum spongiae]|uniref:Flagellar motor switch protein FliG n=1 Tax=Pelagibaculum spongiae TaxID=2080658 RepID=A0A2V1GZL7_9GAMM|nr:flagellar motor switch protein FliG [Pelagibaculum spongiae]PVZ66810.1 flagellar motor switch protein FliG [Pelagibaculum spongiae]
MAGVDRVALLLMTIGEEGAAEVMKQFEPKEVQQIGIAMASLKDVKREAISGVLDAFMANVEGQTSLGMGSDEYIKKMLTQALGEEKAGSVMDRILIGANTKGLDTLKWMDARQVADIIRYEHPQIQAIMVAYLEPDQAAEVLSFFGEKVQLDIVRRVASLDTIQPIALQELNDIMEKHFVNGSAGGQTSGMGGVKTVADMLNFLDSSMEAPLMDAIREIDEELGVQIEDLMFVFDNIGDIDSRGIQALLREVESETLVLALKGADETIREKIFGNMGKRAAEFLREDLDNKGPVKLSEVEGAQKEIISIAKRMADSGEITLAGKGEEML